MSETKRPPYDKIAALMNTHYVGWGWTVEDMCKHALTIERLARELLTKIDNRIEEVDPVTQQKVWRKGCIQMLEEVNTWANTLREALGKEAK